MEAFNLLKQACWPQCWVKKLVNFNQLPIGEHVITSFSLEQTRYGPTIKVDLGDKYVFLPARFARDMTAEKVATLNTVPQILIYHGKDVVRNNL